jgi:hypothetical protein
MTAADAAAAAVATKLNSKLQLDHRIGQSVQADWPFPLPQQCHAQKVSPYAHSRKHWILAEERDESTQGYGRIQSMRAQRR